MTYEEAKRTLPKQSLPAFWIAEPAVLAARWQNLKHGKVEVIAQSPGGRPLHLITYGVREDQKSEANFNSAIAGRKPSAYRDREKRTRPVLFLVGPVHGQETEGLVGLVNLIHILETGSDLRQRPQPTLRRLGEHCRLLILPTGNPDGLARFEPRTSRGMTIAQTEFWGMGTWSDGTIAMWPQSKQLHPFAGSRVGFLGCYFNDRGINPMHDEFFAPLGPEAPAILGVARREAPDLAVSLHSCGSAPEILRPTYVPLEIQKEARTLAEHYYSLLDRARLPHGKTFNPSPESGRLPEPFNLVSALYHTSGATAFTFESPRGLIDEKTCQVDFDQMLDIHLLLFEAMMRQALAVDRRPDKGNTSNNMNHYVEVEVYGRTTAEAQNKGAPPRHFFPKPTLSDSERASHPPLGNESP